MPRTARISAEYQHIVTRGIGKQIIFEDDADRRFYLSLLERYQDQTDVKILAYCLMQNHVHLLIHDTNNETSKFMQKLGFSYAMYFNRKYERVGHLFQNRFYNERVLSERQLLATFRYILNNPVKAGFSSAAMYPWSSYREDGKKGRVSDSQIIEKLIGDRKSLAVFMSLENDDSCLDVENTDEKTADDRSLKQIKKLLGLSSISEIQRMDKSGRRRALAKIKAEGYTIRQIERLTGINRGIIQRAK